MRTGVISILTRNGNRKCIEYLRLIDTDGYVVGPSASTISKGAARDYDFNLLK
jgi:hypothetical protein